MKIALDIDDVIVKFFESYMGFISKKGIKPVKYENIVSYSIWEVLNFKKDKFERLLEEYNNSEDFDNICFVDGAKDGVCFLRDNFDVYFVTARSENVSKKTRDFVFREFGVPEEKVFFSGNIINNGRSKDEICKELGVNYIVEDNGDNSLGYAKNGLRVFLLDKPWNKKIKHKNIFRCRDWNDVLNKVKELKDE